MELVGYKHYMDQLEEKFPEINKKDLARVVRHGLSMLAFFRKNDHDVFLNNNRESLYYYFGNVTTTIEQRYAVSSYKSRRKLRLVWNLANKGKPRNGVYYFGLTDEQFADYLQGKPINRVFLYRVKGETKLYRKNKHFFETSQEDMGWCIVKHDYEAKDAKYLQSRDAERSKSIDYAQECSN